MYRCDIVRLKLNIMPVRAPIVIVHTYVKDVLFSIKAAEHSF